MLCLARSTLYLTSEMNSGPLTVPRNNTADYTAGKYLTIPKAVVGHDFWYAWISEKCSLIYFWLAGATSAQSKRAFRILCVSFYL